MRSNLILAIKIKLHCHCKNLIADFRKNHLAVGANSVRNFAHLMGGFIDIHCNEETLGIQEIVSCTCGRFFVGFHKYRRGFLNRIFEFAFGNLGRLFILRFAGFDGNSGRSVLNSLKKVFILSRFRIAFYRF